MHGNVSEWVEDCWISGYSNAPWTELRSHARIARSGCCGAAPGTTIRGTSGPPTVPAGMLRNEPRVSDSGWPGRCRSERTRVLAPAAFRQKPVARHLQGAVRGQRGAVRGSRGAADSGAGPIPAPPEVPARRPHPERCAGGAGAAATTRLKVRFRPWHPASIGRASRRARKLAVQSFHWLSCARRSSASGRTDRDHGKGATA